MDNEIKPLSEAQDLEEFKALRRAPKEAAAEVAAEKPTQTEEVAPVIADVLGTSETRVQEKQDAPPAEKSVDEQVKDLRAKGKHAAANKLMVESAVKVERERADALVKELETLRAKPVTAQPLPEAKPAAPAQQVVDGSDPEPLSTDEKYSVDGGWSKYQRDLIAHGIRSETRAEAGRQKQAAFKERVGKALAEGAAAHPDFNTVSERVVINVGVLQKAVDHLENIGEVLYKLGSDPAETARVKALDPFDQYAELRSLSNSLKAPASAATAPPPEKLPPPVSRIAPPPRTLTAAADPPTKSTSELGNDQFDEFKRLRKLKRAG